MDPTAMMVLALAPLCVDAQDERPNSRTPS
jgi:hypothetical protein